MLYLWLKTLHITLAIAWSVGIFYMPRMFVHYKLAQQKQECTKRLVIMAKKLFNFSSVMMILTIGLGTGLVSFQKGGWLHAKLFLVFLLFCYHIWIFLNLNKMEHNKLSGSVIFYRIMNELPVLIIFAIVYLVIFKPF